MTGASSSDNPICVALDAPDPEETRRLARATAAAGAHKIGLTAFASGGPALVRDLAPATRLFLDLKLHDIPAQVSGAVAAVAGLDVAFTTIHSFGGTEMMRAAVDGAEDRVMVLAVTVLTSLDSDDLRALGVSADATAQVLHLA
ncbi:MAG: orotidine 5'-phosphate decarboxylase, partial [Actinomycetota bacterium]|nr:orotidine 5'-phosphate decarboxylase [Actinomycetota bacterium]